MGIKMENRIFALDIGTRNVVGLVGVFNKGIFTLEAMEHKEHSRRAMVDGQIEDINEVANIVRELHSRLEERLDTKLEEVYVAAAGRSLLTSIGMAELATSPHIGISTQQVAELQLLAIEAASERLSVTAGANGMVCVGHSVLGYKLDGHGFSSLLNHKGSLISVEIIATFLPQQVVNSLYTTMNIAGLMVAGLTLEPIAAMNAIVPQELRGLNIALVDIGAGTSDIAISDRGTICSYTMATYAGDEITEKIISTYLVDFNMAEEMKKSDDDIIRYTDILGNELTVTAKDLANAISEAVEELSMTVCNNIEEANGRSPQAIFLVGGGSKTPGLATLVAGAMSIDQSRVAVGGNNYMKKMVNSDIDVSDPGYATPFGIAITAGTMLGNDGFFAFVNDKKIRLYSSEKQTVMDALLLSGYKYSQLLGKPSKPLQFTLDGVSKTILGKLATAAAITLNDSPASITSPIKRADRISVIDAIDGEDASAMVAEVVPSMTEQGYVTISEHVLSFGVRVLVNGMLAEPEQQICEGDILEEQPILTLAELFSEHGYDVYSFEPLKDGKPLNFDYRLQDGDEIELGVGEVFIPLSMQTEGELEQEVAEETAQPQEAVSNILYVMINDRRVELPKRQDNSPYLFVDMLNYIEIDPSTPKKNIRIFKNGVDASYLDVVNIGDSINVSWEEN